jgi:hypothetical protein
MSEASLAVVDVLGSLLLLGSLLWHLLMCFARSSCDLGLSHNTHGVYEDLSPLFFCRTLGLFCHVLGLCAACTGVCDLATLMVFMEISCAARFDTDNSRIDARMVFVKIIVATLMVF